SGGYRHESDKVPAYQLSFIRRFFWLLKMTYSPRGVGWSFKVGFNACTSFADLTSSLDRPRILLFLLTRASFIIWRLGWLFSHYLLLEIATLYTYCSPVLLSGASVTSQGYTVQCLNVAVVFFQSYAIITCIHCALAILAVGTNLDEPQTWPQPFGHWKNAHTIRKFWGCVKA
ncbi:hypothetical protein F5J12DRAFT_723772, partial [Pisolithus orientalis]|uniref:uncharacterized protein n=1 Tax=Pisolithus orientalis TaxID=936130 RepID=UPI002224D094